MSVGQRWLLLAVALSACAGSIATLAVQKAAGLPDAREAGALPEFEDRFIREFELPETDRRIVRAILNKFQERRREIEGRAAQAAANELADLGRTIDTELLLILPPAKRDRYTALFATPAAPGPESGGR